MFTVKKTRSLVIRTRLTQSVLLRYSVMAWEGLDSRAAGGRSADASSQVDGEIAVLVLNLH